jgi:hypothetical protein
MPIDGQSTSRGNGYAGVFPLMVTSSAVTRFEATSTERRPDMSSTLAYLDAGSASLLLQTIGGGAAALAVMGKLFWRRILTVLRIKKEPSKGPGLT